MRNAGLSDLVRRAASAEPGALPRWMVGNDRYAGRLDESEIGRLAAAALADGEEAAKSLPAGKNPEALASELGISVDHADAAIDVAGHLFSADYRPKPPRIRLYTRALAAIDRGLAEPGVAEVVGAACAQPVLLAHEIYHHLDLARPAPLARRHRVTTFHLGPLHLKTELPSLAEVAAGRFAATLLGLHCHPKLLDLLLLWDSDPERARVWAAAFCAFASRSAQGGRLSTPIHPERSEGSFASLRMKGHVEETI
jgi:hypothetical protein